MRPVYTCSSEVVTRILQRSGVSLAVAAVAAFATGSALVTAHADLGVSYDGGCAIVQEVIPSQCSYVNLGGDSESLNFVGTGSVSISGCGGTAGPFFSSTSSQAVSGEIGGTTCTVTLSGTGVVTIVDSTHAWGVCAAFSFGEPLDASCDYVALTTVGLAVGEVVTTSQATVTLTIQNLTTGATITCPPGAGVGSITVECPYTEAQGNHYQATLTSTAGDFSFVTVGR